VPLSAESGYRPPWWPPGGHLQTVIPALFRTRHEPGYDRRRLELPDGDFIDLDWLKKNRPRLAVLIHGLEGSSRSHYMAGMARALAAAEHGWDVLAMNLRGCSGEPNRTLRFYHSGDTSDLRTVLASLPETYSSIALIGFSLGGNIVLKYLGEAPGQEDPRVSAAVTYSVPCHLESSAHTLAHPINRLYMKRFLLTLTAKVRDLAHRFPDAVDLSGVEDMRTFLDFDERYTAPLHGFQNARDYWTRSSSRQFLPAIRLPTLLVNAQNDPFLSPECFPVNEVRGHRRLFLECPASGGHLGFPGGQSGSFTWAGERAIRFLNTATENSSHDLER